MDCYGIICIENFTIVILIAVIGVAFVFFHVQNKAHTGSQQTINEKIIVQESSPLRGLFSRPSYSFSNIEKDVLMNPYTPPLKDDSYMPGNSGDPRGIPINISTHGASRNTPYRQVGILTRTNGPETILSLMGRPLFSNRNKWQYYTMNDKGNNIKLPVTNKSKSCTNEYGCDELYNGDSVYVEGINDAFKVTMYDNNTMEYIPYL